ncbi:hypothetical protein E3O25_08905 [Cryobacterium sp. TMT1-3]|nr:hypothetical protein E3O25_08905 [Cryobacterium sp. TMT1-3]
MALFSLTGCAPKTAVATSESVPETAAPTSAPVETAEVPQVAEYAPYAEAVPENLVQYQEMPFEIFETLPKDEQAPYVSWLIRDKDIFVAEWRDQRTGPNDGIDTEVSLDDSDQDALVSSTWMLRMAVSLNTEDAKKVLTFMVEDRAGSVKYDEIIGAADVPDRTPRYMAEGQMMRIPTVTKESELMPIKGVYAKEITALENMTNTVLKGYVFYHEYTDYAGQVYPVWLTRG